MKTKYFSHSLTFFIGGLTSLLLYSMVVPIPAETEAEVCLSSNYVQDIPNPYQQTIEPFDFDSIKNRTQLDSAIYNMSFYRLWLKYAPSCVSMELSNDAYLANYANRTIQDSDLSTIDSLMSLYTKKHPETDSLFPYGGEKSHAIFIQDKDIDSARADFNRLAEGKVYSGVRVYLAARNMAELDEDKTESHLYIVPTYIEEGVHRDFIPYLLNNSDTVRYVYDLTTPCPAACDFASPLQNLTYE